MNCEIKTKLTVSNSLICVYEIVLENRYGTDLNIKVKQQQKKKMMMQKKKNGG